MFLWGSQDIIFFKHCHEVAKVSQESSWLSLHWEAFARRVSVLLPERKGKAFVSQKCDTSKKQSPTGTLINALFYSKISLGLKIREWKCLSAWLLAGGIKFTLLPWQNPQQVDSAAHPCKQVLNFCPRGWGLIAWKGQKHREIRAVLSSPSQEAGCFPGMAVADRHQGLSCRFASKKGLEPK